MQDYGAGYEYEVFLSFCGSDTRRNFTDFLYWSLIKAGIYTFRDDDELDEGENIGKFFKAIEHSKISIPVFSINYASREWCMRELANMVDCKKTRNQKILPIFYDVKPSAVREQSGNFEKALLKHEKEFGKETIGKWRGALREVSLLKGWVSDECFDGHQGKLVDDVISTIWKELKKDKLVVPDHNILGIEDMEESMMKLLDVDANDTRIVVIYGKPASGKTILSKIIYNKISNRFKRSSFLANIKEKSEKQGLESLQKQLIIDILEGNCPHRVHNIDDGVNIISHRFRTKKVLILLDDMNKKEHLDALAKKTEWFGLGSRIIVTTSNRKILEAPEIYGLVEVMNPHQSPVQLLHTEIKHIKFRKNTDSILDSLINDGFSRIGIYGLGGVGKTTLAMNLYDHLTKCHSFFRGVYWVTVSSNCNIYSLQSKVARAVDVDLSSQDDPVLRRAKLLERFHSIGNSLLFLDDVWDYLLLEELGISDTDNRCKLILTSRSLKVCQRMDCNKCFKVNPLPKQGAWNLFVEILGNEMELSGEISQIAQSITKECAGLPLAIITMASSTRGVDDILEWRYCLRMLKEVKEGPESMESEVYPVLKCSYDHLNDTQSQHCLLYSAVYPEDFFIERGKLIHLLIDAGLIKEGSVEAQIDKGHAMLNKLENVCLLEEDTSARFKKYVKMHDLIRDMALRIKKSTFTVKSGQSLLKPPDTEEWTPDLEVVSLMENEIKEISISPKCPRLSTLLISRNKFLEGIQSCFFEYLCGLKVLDLSRTGIKKLPNSVANLVNLTVLLLRYCMVLVSLPSLAKLSSLKRLDLYRSGIKKVPDGKNAASLKYLNLWGNEHLKKIPVGILRKLSNIRCLWIDWPKGDVKVLKKGELGCLQNLEIFQVRFRGWEEYTAFAKSMVKPNRYHAIYDCGDKSYGYECLPHHHKSVRLFGSREDALMLPLLLPEDVQRVKLYRNTLKRLDEIFQRNNVAKLEYCLTFSHLKCLVIKSCRFRERLLKVGFLSNLPNLEELIVFDCNALQEIIAEEEEEEMRLKAGGKNEYTIFLPKLRHLKLEALWELKRISKKKLSCDSLEELEIASCPKLERIPLSLKSVNGRLSPPSSLKRITVSRWTCEEAKEWWESLKWDILEAKMVLQPFVVISVWPNPTSSLD